MKISRTFAGLVAAAGAITAYVLWPKRSWAAGVGLAMYGVMDRFGLVRGPYESSIRDLLHGAPVPTESAARRGEPASETAADIAADAANTVPRE